MSPRCPRRFCCDEELALIGYDGREAEANLAALRQEGPRPQTQELIDVVVGQGVDGGRVLDVGAGVGAVHLALLAAGAATAVDVDASREYIAAARSEAQRRGLAERVEHQYGDLVELAGSLGSFDVVTLDAVICCYPWLANLISAVVGRKPRVIGLTYPRDTWWMRTFMRVYNVAHSLVRSPGRYFAHRHATVRGLLADSGYAEIHNGGSRAWRVAVYRGA
jgi:SAM-dependent methyltransferase